MKTTHNNPMTPHRSSSAPAQPRRAWAQRALALLAFSVLTGQGLLVNSIQAQDNLRDTIRAKQVDWIVGDWRGTNDQGQPLTVEYEWELEGHMLEIDLTMGDLTYKGAILRRAADGSIVEAGGDNFGGTTQSTWEVEDGALISKRTGTGPDGQVIRVAVKNRKVDGDTVVATVHALSPGGELGEEALDTVRLTRSSKQDDED